MLFLLLGWVPPKAKIILLGDGHGNFCVRRKGKLSLRGLGWPVAAGREIYAPIFVMKGSAC
jgi:hypothetical protein